MTSAPHTTVTNHPSGFLGHRHRHLHLDVREELGHEPGAGCDPELRVDGFHVNVNGAGTELHEARCLGLGTALEEVAEGLAFPQAQPGVLDQWVHASA